jgi:hypothetical protein
VIPLVKEVGLGTQHRSDLMWFLLDLLDVYRGQVECSQAAAIAAASGSIRLSTLDSGRTKAQFRAGAMDRLSVFPDSFNQARILSSLSLLLSQSGIVRSSSLKKAES